MDHIKEAYIPFDVYRIVLDNGLVQIWFQDSMLVEFPREQLRLLINALELLEQRGGI